MINQLVINCTSTYHADSELIVSFRYKKIILLIIMSLFVRIRKGTDE